MPRNCCSHTQIPCRSEPRIERNLSQRRQPIERITRIYLGDIKLQDLPKEKLIEIIISTNKRRDRQGKKWHKVAMYWKGAFMNACHNQMEVVQENRALKAQIKELKRK